MWKFNLLNTKITDEKIAIAKYVAKWGKTWYMVNINKWNTCIICFGDMHVFGDTKEESIKKMIDKLYNYQTAKTHICKVVKLNPEQYAEI
jgi:hypothetical protein